MRAEELWKQRKELARRACELAAHKLLEVKNDSWLEDGEVAITADEFIQRMKLESITVDEDGKFNFWFEDGDLFFGHSIEVRGDAKGAFFDSSVQG